MRFLQLFAMGCGLIALAWIVVGVISTIGYARLRRGTRSDVDEENRTWIIDRR
jgi:hypothetical protein